jgi:hypothetical protein
MHSPVLLAADPANDQSDSGSVRQGGELDRDRLAYRLESARFWSLPPEVDTA